MKKVGWLAVMAALILAAGLFAAAQAEGQLPAEILETLNGPEVLKTAYWDSPGSTWFVLARTPYGENILLCFVQEGGSWVRSFATADAVPQGEGAVEYFFITDKVVSFRDGQTRVVPGPVLAMHDRTGSRTSYRRDDSGQWKLFIVTWQDEQTSLEYSDGSIVFRSPLDRDRDRVVTVTGSFERDLRNVVLDSIPRTPQQAQQQAGGGSPGP